MNEGILDASDPESSIYPSTLHSSSMFPPSPSSGASSSYSASSAARHSGAASSTHDAGGGQVQPQAFVRPDPLQSDFAQVPPHAQALAQWAAKLANLMRDPGGTPRDRHDRFAIGLLDMSEDPGVPEEFRTEALRVILDSGESSGASPFISFENSVREASLALAGGSRDAVDKFLYAASLVPLPSTPQMRPPGLNLGPAPQPATNAAGAPVFMRSMQAPATTAGNALPMALPASINAFPSNPTPPVQTANNADPAFLIPPAQRMAVNQYASPRVKNTVNRMLAEPARPINEIAQDLVNDGRYSSIDSARMAVLDGKRELAFGASNETRDTVLRRLQWNHHLNNRNAYASIGRSLSAFNVNSNPLFFEALTSAVRRHIEQGGQHGNMTWSDLTPHVPQEYERIYEAFLNKPSDYVTAGPVSPGATSVAHSRAMLANQQPQPQPQPQPADHFAQFPYMPMAGNAAAAASAAAATGGTASSSSAPDPLSENAKRQRVSGGFDTTMNTPFVMAPAIDPPGQPVAPPMQQPAAFSVTPLGAQTSMPGQVATGGTGQPVPAVGTAGVVATPDLRPSQSLVPGDQALAQQQLLQQPAQPQPPTQLVTQPLMQPAQSQTPRQPL